MNYRQLYKERYSIDFGGDYDIHHIDFNHSNNDISNLLLLPHDLHVKYHNLVNYYSNSKQKIISPLITGNEVNANTYLMDLLEDLIRTITECNKWYDYKLYLDGKLPTNIHNIEVQ